MVIHLISVKSIVNSLGNINLTTAVVEGVSFDLPVSGNSAPSRNILPYVTVYH